MLGRAGCFGMIVIFEIEQLICVVFLIFGIYSMKSVESCCLGYQLWWGVICWTRAGYRMSRVYCCSHKWCTYLNLPTALRTNHTWGPADSHSQYTGWVWFSYSDSAYSMDHCWLWCFWLRYVCLISNYRMRPPNCYRLFCWLWASFLYWWWDYFGRTESYPVTMSAQLHALWVCWSVRCGCVLIWMFCWIK